MIARLLRIIVTQAHAHRSWLSARRSGLAVAFAVAMLAMLFALAIAHPAAAHPELVRAEPPEDGLLAAPPQTIELWVTERVDEGGGSPGLNVLDADGIAVTVSNVRVDPRDPRHIVGDVSDVSSGTYTVNWTARSADDGHTLTGTFAFRVGTGTAPGAATVEGENPQPWAVATRWLTFLGIAVAAAGFLYRPLLLAGATGEPGRLRRRAIAATAGAVVALLVSAAEPLLQTWFPPEGAIEPTFDDAVAGMPNAWWLRLGAAALTVTVSVLILGMRRRNDQQSFPALEWASGAVALATLVGLSFTSHAAARESWRALAVASDTLHQWAVALWVGGLAQLAISWPPGRDAGDDEASAADPIRRFSRYALILVVAGASTGVLNAGLVLPALRELWQSDYGRVLIAKASVLLPVLALATFHRVRLHQTAVRIGTALRQTVRLEAAIVLFVVLGGSILALLAPPATAGDGRVEFLDLAAPLAIENPELALNVRLQVSPAEPGDNTITVLLTDQAGVPVPPDQVALVRLNFQSLNFDAEQRDVEATPDGQGGFVSDGTQFSLGGWWRVETLVRRLGLPDGVATFYLMLPDPNVNGMNAPESHDEDDEAKALFDRGMATRAAATQVHYHERLADGVGNYVESDHLVDAGDGDRPPAADVRSGDLAMITIGNRQWFRRAGNDWIEREATPIRPPSEWGATYANASGFQLGATEEIDGEMAQMISFVVPGTARVGAQWYTWWVGVESGHILRETMVANSHYMLQTFIAYNEPMDIKPPEMEAVATPTSG